MKLSAYIGLPKEISAFERKYLDRINRIALGFLAVHVPLMTLFAWLNHTGPLLALGLTTAIVLGPALAWKTFANPRHVSVTYGIAAMFMGGALVHFGQGPVQIEMHFYFFALLAMLAAFANPAVILAAAVTVALHHLVLWAVLPRSVFNYDAALWVVLVHAAFVVLESVAACYIARSFFDNVIGLERIVAERTRQLDARNREMRLVLDNVEQGFCTVDLDGKAGAERSLVMNQWFEIADGGKLFEAFGPEFDEAAGLAWDQVKEGFLPLELSLAQMPNTLVRGDSEYRVDYVPITAADGTPSQFLVVVTDVTASVRKERVEAEQRETLHVFEKFLSDRGAVNDFFEEAAAMVQALPVTTDLVEVKRLLHTLKGNSAVFGAVTLATYCHDLESWIVEEGVVPPAAKFAKITERWDRLQTEFETIAGMRRRVIELDEAEHGDLEHAVRDGENHRTLLRMVQSMKLEPTKRRLELFAEQARRIASRLGKEVDVRIDAHDLRLDPHQWGPFWSAFIHVVRNALDHGIEPVEERVEAGKSPRATVALRTYVRDGRFVVEVAEDGRGVDWRAVARKAEELGLPSETAEDLHGALFRDGLSTVDGVSELSGRGIGMGAVRAATEALGGVLQIETERGHGTTVRMAFPEDAMAPHLHALPRHLSANLERGAVS